jgi:hypothetical protein
LSLRERGNDMFFWTLWNRANRTVNLEPNYVEVVTPERLIRMYESERDNIESVRVLPGKLGDRDFGGFVVRRRRPIYTPLYQDSLISNE